MEVSSTPTMHRPGRRSRRGIGVAAVRTASLSERRPERQRGLLPGYVAGSAGGLLGVATPPRAGAALQARASHRHSSRLPGRGHRQSVVGLRCCFVEGAGLSSPEHHHAPGHDCRTAAFAAVADAQEAGNGRRPGGGLGSCFDPADRQLCLCRPRPAQSAGEGPSGDCR